MLITDSLDGSFQYVQDPCDSVLGIMARGGGTRPDIVELDQKDPGRTRGYQLLQEVYH